MDTFVGNHVGICNLVFDLTCVSNGEKMYSQTINKQFPVRLGVHLQKEFDRISEETHINKSKLVRIAVENLVRNIDENGIGKRFKSIVEI